MQQQEEEQFKVAPIISDDKLADFKQSLLQTITGIHKDNLTLHRIEQLIILFPVTLIVPLVVESRAAAIIIPTAINTVLNLVEDFLRLQSYTISQVLIRNAILGIYSFLWSSHLYFLKWYCPEETYNIVLSAVSILTSIYSIARHPVKEFSGNGVDNQSIGWNSTAYMRFFIALPTLLAEFIIFNSAQRTGVTPDNGYLFPLRLINSMIFVVWWLGWLTSLGSTFYFVFNKAGMLILGNESVHTLRDSLMGIIVNMVPIIIYQILYERRGEVSLSSMIIGSSSTSIITFFRYNCFFNTLSSSKTRPIVMIILEALICMMLVLVYKNADLAKINLTVLLAIDVGLYAVMNLAKQVVKGWSIFGCVLNAPCVKYKYLLMLQRIALRVVSALSVLAILTNHAQDFYAILPYDRDTLISVALPFLAYRSFKRCISQTTSFSLHVSLLICLIAVNTGATAQGTLLVLMMPPFPSSAWIAFLSIFKIPKKLRHKQQGWYQILYLLGTIVGVCLHLVSFGTLELTMVFGVPFYWAVVPNETPGFQVRSAENSLYEKILQNIDKQMFQFYECGYYLLRIEKYILLLEIKSNVFGFCELVEVRGLQVQEVTSCHSKEGETIDKLVDETWGDNKKSFTLEPYEFAITPLLKEKVHVPTENDIQLVGIIEDKAFVALWKSTALKAIIREFSKIKLNENQLGQAQVVLSQFSALYKKEAADSLFPFAFAQQCGVVANYPQHSNQSGKVRLPPLNQKGKKAEVINDFMDLLENSHNEKFEASNTALFQKQKSGLEEQNKKEKESNKQPKLDEINMAAILTFYYYAVGKQDYINTEKLYRLIKRESDVVTQIQFEGFNKLVSLALGAAFKISLDKFIEGQTEVSLSDFEDYDKTSFLGTSDSEQFKTAILQDKQNVWSLGFSKRTLNVRRLARSETSMYIFNVSQLIIKSVWNNLRFELIYAANNNDERYSIQTHPNLLRNLWVEACEEPFGYPSYQSGLLLVY